MALSGKKTVTTAGTQEALAANTPVNCPVAIKALAANTGVVYVGDENVSSSTGFELSAGEVIILDALANLASLWVDSAVNGEGVCWLLLAARTRPAS